MRSYWPVLACLSIVISSGLAAQPVSFVYSDLEAAAVRTIMSAYRPDDFNAIAAPYKRRMDGGI